MPTSRCVLAALAAIGAATNLAGQETNLALGATALSGKVREMATGAPLAVAHRGASSDHPENTLAAFRAAVEAGAPIVELDFRQTVDGALVVLHDDTFDRTTNSRTLWKKKKVRVDSVTLAEVQELDAGLWKHPRFAGTRVPTLEEALEVIQKKSITMIEHKAGDPERLVALLTRMKIIDRVLVQSFDWPWLRRLHRLEPRLTIAALGDDPLNAEALKELPRVGASIAHWSAKRLSTDDVALLQRRGYLVCAYTLNSDLELLGAAAIGLDLITTDRPARLRSLLAGGGARRTR